MSLELIKRNDAQIYKLSSPSGCSIFVKPKDNNTLEVTNPQGKKDGYCVALNGKSVRVGARGDASDFLNELRAMIAGH
jgi:hypothetical protein